MTCSVSVWGGETLFRCLVMIFRENCFSFQITELQRVSRLLFSVPSVHCESEDDAHPHGAHFQPGATETTDHPNTLSATEDAVCDSVRGSWVKSPLLHFLCCGVGSFGLVLCSVALIPVEHSISLREWCCLSPCRQEGKLKPRVIVYLCEIVSL